MNPEIIKYNESLPVVEQKICNLLAGEIDRGLSDAESKIWHGHPVWFLDGNPIVGYGRLKDCIRLLFWSGQSFQEHDLKKEGKFKAAEARFTSFGQVDLKKLNRWLRLAREIQWNYKGIASKKGCLERLK